MASSLLSICEGPSDGPDWPGGMNGIDRRLSQLAQAFFRGATEDNKVRGLARGYVGCGSMKLDVCVPTLDPLSEEFIGNIEKNVPLNRLLTSTLPGRGRARQDLIDRVETEFFAFVDTDIVLLPNWFESVTAYLGPDVGAVEGSPTETTDSHLNRLNFAMERLNLMLGRRYKLEEASRAFTGATIVRTSSVQGIRIPDINYYEDEFIRRYILARGYSWKKTKEMNHVHRRGPRLERVYDAARCGYYIGYLRAGDQVRRLLLQTPGKALFAFVVSGDPYALQLELERQAETVRGVLHARAQGYRAPVPSGP